MKDISLEKLRFLILPSANPPEHLADLHNKAFRLWKSVWQETLEKLNFSANNLTEEFVRQDLIACITYENNPIAVHLYSFFAIDCEAARTHGYFSSNYPELYFAKLAKEKVRNVMSMEYMTVHPEWRKSKETVHLGGALGGLAVRSMHELGADAAIAPCRRDHKVHEMAYAYGGEPVVANVVNHNVACDLVMIRREKVKAHPSEDVQNLLESLWKKVEFYSSFRPVPAMEELLERKKAA